jgi:MFS family permease
MKLKQLGALFIIQVAFNSVGGALGALLPVFAGKLGADPASVGLLLALLSTGFAVGVLFSGWLSDRWQHRKVLLIGAAIISTILLAIAGQSASLIQLTIMIVLVATCNGTVVSMFNTLAGLSAGEAERGRVFGILGSTVGIGLLIGGLISGPVVDRWDYSGLFVVAAFLNATMPIAGLFLADKKVAHVAGRGQNNGSVRGIVQSRRFILLVLASIVAFAANGMQGLTRSLMMDQHHFLATDITSTVSVSGLVSIPFPFVIGWLSDRVGRTPLLIVGYLATAAGVFLLTMSTSLWHFWLSTALATLTGASFTVGLAMVTDLVPAEGLGIGIALFGATNFFGLIIGSELTGIAIQNLGMTPSLLLGSMVGLVAVGLVLLIRRPAPFVSRGPAVELANSTPT